MYYFFEFVLCIGRSLGLLELAEVTAKAKAAFEAFDVKQLNFMMKTERFLLSAIIHTMNSRTGYLYQMSLGNTQNQSISF